MKNLLSALSAYVCMGALPARPRGVPEPEHEFPLDGTARDAVLVIDASPSMLTADWPPSRLEAAQVAASAFVKRLFANEAESRVALVAYAGNATVVFGLLPSLFFYQITAAIAGITPRQATNITAGLEAAAEILKSSEREQQVVLLSDGFHNHGPKPRSIAASLRRRATLECVGIGGRPSDVDEALLKAIASTDEYGRKRYRWIGEPEKLVRHFENLAGGLKREP